MPDRSTITVEIDLDLTLPIDGTQTGEDTWSNEPTTMRDLIVREAARQMAAPLAEQARKDAAKLVQEAAQRLVDAELPDMIRAALDEPQTITDDWGHAKGTKSLRDMVRERVASQTQMGSDRGFGRGQTVLGQTIEEQVDRALAGEFKEEIAAARQAVRDTLTTKAAELLAAETLREAGFR